MPTGEAWAHSTVPLNSVEDLKGLTMRCRGDAGTMLNELGVSTVFMPAGEIYEALQRGVIDAAEMDALSSNWPYGYHEVAEYLYLSKARAQASPGFFVVYNGSWNKLSEADKMIVEYMCKAFNDYTSHMYTVLDIEAYEMFKAYGVKIAPIPCDINSALRAEAEKYYANRAAADPFYKQVLDSQTEFYRVFNEAEELHRPIYCDDKI
jgi:TRAP-type mannitol/chloroaromatic compound transport system substrate-binding protein